MGLTTMNRRIFMALCGAGVAIGPSPTEAQGVPRSRTIGVLMGLADDRETQARTRAIEQGLAKRGWIVGQNLRIEYRYAASDPNQMASLSQELVALHPDVIVGHSTPVVAALLKATHSIPIVFVLVSDPVGSGFVASLARPGGNVTGFSVLQPTITGKYLSILRELDSKIVHVGLMYNPEAIPSAGAPYTPSFEQSAKQFGIVPITDEVRSEDQIESAMTILAGMPHSALIVLPDNYITVHRRMIIALASKLRIPAIYSYRYYADEGGLLSYGVDVLDLFRRAPDYIDRILRGAAPADLPVQAPRKFELVINVKAANALGLNLPRILLAGADALIE
jgi:putative tryptophan/tyrosine transport system substrate-binding protein